MKKKTNVGKASFVYVAAITAALIAFIILLGPMDSFHHGYFCDDEVVSEAIEQYVSGHIDLGEEDYWGKFRPMKPHFTGIELYLANQPQGNTGTLYGEILDAEGNTIDIMSADLSKVLQDRWWKLYSNRDLRVNEIYSLHIYADGCSIYPYLRIMDGVCIADETLEGNLLLGYAYEKSTFSVVEKSLIIMFACAIYLLLISLAVSKIKYRKTVADIGVFLLLVTGMSWQYMFNSLDNKNTTFADFQADSEALVSGTFIAERDGLWRSGSYGLGYYCNLTGSMNHYKTVTFITDNNWREGYNRAQAGICLDRNDYTVVRAVEGNKVKFSNGEIFDIINIESNEWYINIFLDSTEVLTPERCGDIEDIIFCDPEGADLPAGILRLYPSQFGLQGKVFRQIAMRLEEENTLQCINLLCSIATAVVFMIIVIIINKKYNFLLAACFFVTFLLSPWVVNFARNLYWVEFTWFVPMMVGLFCAWKIDNQKCRVISYIGAFISILGKCLCGYEYISAIMMGLIAFLLVDLIVVAGKKDKHRIVLMFRTIVIIGACALIGFVAAICLHAIYTGNGNILVGIHNIIEGDALRRTSGADLNNFIDALKTVTDSQTASTWEVLSKYFHFSTEVITGITGNLFPILCVAPLAIFALEYHNTQLNLEKLAFYIVFFLVSVSWLVLAKAHSYVHIHMNYVLWYFGFVQMCFYIIIDKIAEGIKNSTGAGEEKQ